MTRIAVIVVVLAGCSGTARGLEAYRADTQKVLEAKSPDIKRCYDEALKADAKSSGVVVVKFTVEHKTGAITTQAVDPAKTTAPKPVSDCVLQAMQGLRLDPPDNNDGRATFAYEFRPS
jgi:hypothetical protein